MQTAEAYGLVYGSHEWKLDSSQIFSAESVMLRLTCARCGASIIMIMNPGESAVDVSKNVISNELQYQK